ncbi:hypothetical protein PQD13_gp79 [Gordonia phage Clawz]|uniref:DNA-binding phage zinc finger domain-containing protein n=1 Tax=Gordonia phage Clawz TaxID=2743910 RepID=A0AAE7F846_9CAUD|nr:hypothetical protein PQD13_gp79 [Gordonia phage Clawz]QKY79991.1 hypothetical protein SEA_CLAWZ_79 [Gordonia phage Clawz]
MSEKNDVAGVICPNCNAQPGHPCTQPTDTGRRNVTWFHNARFNRLTGWGYTDEK